MIKIPKGNEMNYLDVYRLKLAHLKLMAIKKLRRYGIIRMNLLDMEGNKKSEIIMKVIGSKIIVLHENNIIKYDDMNTAWEYYQNLIYEEFPEERGD